jgi:hypothetical protein
MMGVTGAAIRNGARCPIFGLTAQSIAANFSRLSGLSKYYDRISLLLTRQD